MRFGSVKSLLVISSVCLPTQSMMYSGNPAIFLLFIFIIFPISNGFALSISILICVPAFPGSPIRMAGPPRFTDLFPRADTFL